MGMLPVFASCAPFYRWVNRRFRLGDGDTEIAPADEVADIDRVLDDVISKEGGYENFVGVIGFSQGARLAPGLILRQLVEVRETGESKWGFKFGLLVGGPFPPICLTEGTEVGDYELLKRVPIVNAWGRDDPVRAGCKPMVSRSVLPNPMPAQPRCGSALLHSALGTRQTLRNGKRRASKGHAPALISQTQLQLSRDVLTDILSLKFVIGWAQGACLWILRADTIYR